ncbi:MAG: thioredoxin domain-containing protein, partial [bacterium]|nr:thioredoxin domain-containing protein [bacterium]
MALPGAPTLSEDLRTRLATELAGRGPEYEPRTRNLRADGSPLYTNRLLLESSPYLQQHAHNPVNWRPWGDEAFAAAERLGRPVLVSIGYSTCHWCHVMEEESFDDPNTARFLNQHFVTIKVDRETRPDVDAIYMSAIQALGQRGGWPLNVWLTPDRKPFYAGTYFPPQPGPGRPDFMSVLHSIQKQYSDNPEEILRFSADLTERIRADLEGTATDVSRIPGADVMRLAADRYARVADPTWGGVGQQTKFPSRLPIRFLLRYQRRTGDSRALDMATLALDKMAAGGIYDHVGGGFHRYSTEVRWLVPHFEKMLYDNAQLSLA